MKELLLFLCLSFLYTSCVEQIPKVEKDALESTVQKTSYIIGYNLSNRLQANLGSFDRNILNKGISDGSKLKPVCLFSDKEIEEIKKEYALFLLSKKEDRNAQKASANLKEQENFFEKNAKKEGVIVMGNGVQYKVIRSGDGLVPKKDQVVTVYFKSRKLNGETLFISEKTPTTWALDDTLPGVKQALLQMPAGSIWQVFIPSELAYGEHGIGKKIEPNMAIVYEIELLSVNKIKP